MTKCKSGSAHVLFSVYIPVGSRARAHLNENPFYAFGSVGYTGEADQGSSPSIQTPNIWVLLSRIEDSTIPICMYYTCTYIVG